jgi:hypothetical protein
MRKLMAFFYVLPMVPYKPYTSCKFKKMFPRYCLIKDFSNSKPASPYLTTIGTPCLTAMIEAMGSAVYGTPQYRPPGLGTATGNILWTKRKHGVPTFLLNDYLEIATNKNCTRLSARCHFTGPKKVSISRAQPLPTCPCNGSCPHQKYYGRVV